MGGSRSLREAGYRPHPSGETPDPLLFGTSKAGGLAGVPPAGAWGLAPAREATLARAPRMTRMTTLQIEALLPDQAEGAAPLSVEAGWNQIAADWRLMLGEGRGFGVRDASGSWIASALVLPLGPAISWISMVLVTKPSRRQGHGTRLLQRCFAEIEATGVTAGLDATELGRPVYLPLGFRDVYPLSRWRAEAGQRHAVEPPHGVRVRSAGAGRPAAHRGARCGAFGVCARAHRRSPAGPGAVAGACCRARRWHAGRLCAGTGRTCRHACRPRGGRGGEDRARAALACDGRDAGARDPGCARPASWHHERGCARRARPRLEASCACCAGPARPSRTPPASSRLRARS